MGTTVSKHCYTMLYSLKTDGTLWQPGSKNMSNEQTSAFDATKQLLKKLIEEQEKRVRYYDDELLELRRGSAVPLESEFRQAMHQSMDAEQKIKEITKILRHVEDREAHPEWSW